MIVSSERGDIQSVLIVSITPYFLEKGCVWFQQHLKKILAARKTQSFFEDNTFYLELNQTVSLSELLRKLDEMGYEKVHQVAELGEFAQRGGVVDVFPVNRLSAVRIEFKGNTIEHIEQLAAHIAEADEEKAKKLLQKKLKSQKLFSDLHGLKTGDYLVHLDHGIGTFAGFLDSLHDNEPEQKKTDQSQYYLIAYAHGDKLYIPFGLERKLSRYVGFAEPRVTRLGSAAWYRTKRKIKEEALKFAQQLLALYASRELATRPAYTAPDELALHLAASFPYEETPDQKQALQDIAHDLAQEKPMDRLVCGDVGFGKTEVALRAAFQAVRSGYPVVLLCPTTILAHQHFTTFQERLGKLPVRTALLTRLQTPHEQARIIEDLKKHNIDILIGTHRVLSHDVTRLLFPAGRGLFIIDDEQRFGVRQKEKLKELRKALDVLSLSATPIPRTLHLALASLKDMSIIHTPPEGRQPVKTLVQPRSLSAIATAITQELARKGQVYYLYNRVATIGMVKQRLQKLLPSVRFAVAHGRMSERELIGVLNDFRAQKYDVLLATTIIENGLDVPNVNTLIVDDATKLGLSQAYQVRGRVGRSHRHAIAYFFYPKRLSEKAQLRLKALQEAEVVGSGYRIALKDLEIRGAGNILGREQSGSVNKVGLNLYCQMVAEAVEKLREQTKEKA